MECVILYDYYVPAYKAGGPIQSLKNLVEHLGNEIRMRVICSNCDLDGTELAVQKDTWTDSDKAKVYYISPACRNLPYISPDSILFINGIYSIKFNLMPALKFKGRRIISARGMLHPEALMQKSLKKQFYLRLLRLLRVHRNCEFHATSQEEKDFVLNIFGKKSKVWVASNFPHLITYKDPPLKIQGSLKLVSVALISKMKNHLLVLKALMNCRYDVQYNIYGPVKDEEYWSKCQEQINDLPKNITVNYHGSISPMEVEKALAQHHVMIQPSESENFGHSIFEALSSGRPVITSTTTPWNNLESAKAGMNVNTNEDYKGLAKAIDFFCEMDNAQLKLWSENASSYARQAVNIEAIKHQYKNMFNNQQ